MNKTLTTCGVGLLVQSERKDGYFHVRVYPVRLDSEGPDSVRNISTSSYGDDAEDCWHGFYLPDMLIDSQGNDDRRDRSLYGFTLTYNPYRVTARSATRMAKTLTTLAKRLEKLDATRGYVRSFGEYVGRIAEVMGIDTILMRPKEQQRYTSHTEGRYNRWNLGDGVSCVDSIVREWQEHEAVAS